MRNLSTLTHGSALGIVLGFMADEPASGGDSAKDAKKPTIELVTDRRVFSDLAAAGAALAGIAEKASDWATVTLVAPGASFNEAGEFVPEAEEWTAPTHEIMLAPLATKAQTDGKGNETKPARLIALVLAPIPTAEAIFGVESIPDSPSATAFREVLRKELNHRAVRKLRTAENVLAASTEMPLSLESYSTSQAGGGASGLAAFDDHWLLYSQALAKHTKKDAKGQPTKEPSAIGLAWSARFPGGKGKPAIRAAIENAARAQALFPELESFGPEGNTQSLFVRLLNGVISAATKAGQDTTLLSAWLDTRDQQTYDPGSEADSAVDFDSLFDDMADDDATGDGSESGDESGDDAGDPPTGTDEAAEANATE